MIRGKRGVCLTGSAIDRRGFLPLAGKMRERRSHVVPLAVLALLQIIPFLHLRRVASRLPDDQPVQPLLKRRRHRILMVCGFWVLFLVMVFVF